MLGSVFTCKSSPLRLRGVLLDALWEHRQRSRRGRRPRPRVTGLPDAPAPTMVVPRLHRRHMQFLRLRLMMASVVA